MEKNCNIGWYFYRDYFRGIELHRLDDKKYQETVERLLALSNNNLIQTKFQPDRNSKKAFILETIYPGLVAGTGYSHEVSATGEFKLGMFFDYTTGQPVIPGSSVKGLLRSAFPQWQEDEKTFSDKRKQLRSKWIAALVRELKSDNFNKKTFLGQPIEPDESFEDYAYVRDLEFMIFEGIKDLSAKKPKDKYMNMYERDIFYDAIIVKTAKNERIFESDAITPHIKDPSKEKQELLKNPVPLPFLKIMPGVGFGFNFCVKDCPQLKAEKKLLLFEKILLTLGVGAKTRVGYGRFKNEYKEKAGQNITTEKQTKDDLRSKTEAENYTGKLKQGEILQAKVVDQENKVVEVTVNGEKYNVQLNGNCPVAGQIVRVGIGVINKDKKIIQVSLKGLI